MTQYYEERIISFKYPERIETEELESLEIEDIEEQPKSQGAPSRLARVLERLREKAKFNNRYFETSHTVDKNKQKAIIRPTGYFKF